MRRSTRVRRSRPNHTHVQDYEDEDPEGQRVIGWNELKLDSRRAESAEFIHFLQYEPPPPQRRRRRRGRPTQYDTVDLIDDDSEAPQRRTVNTGGRPVQYDNSEVSSTASGPY